ncbi:myristoyl-CoA:protein N-myristoyltransferase, partial [Helicosporidium sp. ATCC 50920]
PAVGRLLRQYLGRFRLAPEFSDEEVRHWLLPRKNVVHAFVVDAAHKGTVWPEQEEGAAAEGEPCSSSAPEPSITGLISFYTLPSTVIGHPKYDSMCAAYQFYTVPGATPPAQILNDALVLAQLTGHDVFNALDILENAEVLKDLKFGIGDGKLRYYLYNWRVKEPVQAKDVGLIML